MTTVPQERNKFIEELCQTFFDLFTDYWRLGNMYLNSMLTINRTDITIDAKAMGKEKSNFAILVPLIKEITRKKTPDEFFSLVGGILNTFSDIVRAAFIPHTFDKEKDKDKEKDESTANTGGGDSVSSQKSITARTLFVPWPVQHDAKIISQILPHCLRSCRFICKMTL